LESLFLKCFVDCFKFTEECLGTLSQVSADTTKKKINALSMELIEAKNKLDAKDKVSSLKSLYGEVCVTSSCSV